MPEPEASQARGDGVSTGDPLPLFRPEALAAPDRFYGDIMRIRPFSAAILGWVGAIVLGAAASFLIFGQHMETLRTAGVVVAVADSTQETPAESVLIEIPITLSNRGLLSELKPGRQGIVRCLSCAEPSAQIAVTILAAPAAMPWQEPAAGDARNQVIHVVLKGSPDAGVTPPGTKLELAIPVGRRSLMRWLLESRGS